MQTTVGFHEEEECKVLRELKEKRDLKVKVEGKRDANNNKS